MAKYLELADDNQKIFDDVIKETELERVINIKVLAVNNLKEIGKLVKTNELVKYMTDEDLVILINESIFDQLEDIQKYIVVEELLAGIHFDYEKDKLSIGKPDISTFTGILRKFTFPIYERLHETIKALYDQEKDKKEKGEVTE
jgi:hypothetical protein